MFCHRKYVNSYISRIFFSFKSIIKFCCFIVVGPMQEYILCLPKSWSLGLCWEMDRWPMLRQGGHLLPLINSRTPHYANMCATIFCCLSKISLWVRFLLHQSNSVIQMSSLFSRHNHCTLKLAQQQESWFRERGLLHLTNPISTKHENMLYVKKV